MFVAPDSASQFPLTHQSQGIPGIIASACTQCGDCLGNCNFLASSGTPGRIAETYAKRPKDCLSLAYGCSLCGLCASVCPKGLEPDAMFLTLRQEAIKKNQTDLSLYKGILSYEKKGVSKRFSYYSLPEHSDTVFFPGCTLPGTRPGQTLKAFEYLKTRIKNMGIVLDCCTKPSHDLGRKDFFSAMFSEMEEFLLKNKIRTIVVACPNCHKIFTTHGKFRVKTLYEIMAEDQDSGDFFTEPPTARPRSAPPKTPVVTVHDPCPVRHAHSVHKAVRTLAKRQGLSIEESPLSREKTLCCGEGGAVGCIKPDLARNWAKKRRKDAKGKPTLTYCAGCTNFLSRGGARTFHILDLVYHPQKTISGKADGAKAPFTYLNRLNLKRKLKKEEKNQPRAVYRERTFYHGKKSPNHSMGRLLILGLVLAAMAGLKTTGVTQNLDPEILRAEIALFGNYGPAIYMLIYALAPCLMLPGLPLTIAGGILFGPFWGVVYTIFGATAGAGLAFVISRYVSGSIIKNRLTGQQWKKLHHRAEKDGWKMVAATRLIPLFPFNLLNYALGLTPVKFTHYILTTFICMLPACIALVVFSSSLVDLVKGKFSPGFFLGLALLALVSILPRVYQKIKPGKKLPEPM